MRPAITLLVAALLLLQPAWYLWLAPPTVVPPAFAAAAMSTPLLPVVLLLLLRRPSAGFWAGIAALFYFSHGVMEAWASPDVRALALVEAILAMLLVVASSWAGLRARMAARHANPPAPGDAGR
jgi:uncharacterized membrane protein